jgi:hypothetical protein
VRAKAMQTTTATNARIAIIGTFSRSIRQTSTR